MNRLKDLDLYKLLEVTFDAEESTIRKAYRKKALQCHPDKNPDDPKAAEIFHQVCNAHDQLEVTRGSCVTSRLSDGRPLGPALGQCHPWQLHGLQKSVFVFWGSFQGFSFFRGYGALLGYLPPLW